MHEISGKKIAILATHGYEQSELEVPLKKLAEARADVHIVSLEEGDIRGWDQKDWGRPRSRSTAHSTRSVPAITTRWSLPVARINQTSCAPNPRPSIS